MDKILRGLNHKKNIKITIVEATDTVNEIISLQNTNSIASVIVARGILCNTMVGCEAAKSSKKISSIINGQGRIGTLIFDYSENTARAFCANPNFDGSDLKFSKTIIGDVLGTDGTLEVRKVSYTNQPFSGQVAIQTGEITDEFAAYLEQSEQIKSLISCGVKLGEDNHVAHAFGIMVQLLPGYSDDDLVWLESKQDELAKLSVLWQKYQTAEELLQFFGPETQLLGKEGLSFACSCSKAKAVHSILMLPESDRLEIIEQNETLHINCDFCRRRYDIKVEDWQNLK